MRPVTTRDSFVAASAAAKIPPLSDGALSGPFSPAAEAALREEAPAGSAAAGGILPSLKLFQGDSTAPPTLSPGMTLGQFFLDFYLPVVLLARAARRATSSSFANRSATGCASPATRRWTRSTISAWPASWKKSANCRAHARRAAAGQHDSQTLLPRAESFGHDRGPRSQAKPGRQEPVGGAAVPAQAAAVREAGRRQFRARGNRNHPPALQRGRRAFRAVGPQPRDLLAVAVLRGLQPGPADRLDHATGMAVLENGYQARPHRKLAAPAADPRRKETAGETVLFEQRGAGGLRRHAADLRRGQARLSLRRHAVAGRRELAARAAAADSGRGGIARGSAVRLPRLPQGALLGAGGIRSVRRAAGRGPQGFSHHVAELHQSEKTERGHGAACHNRKSNGRCRCSIEHTPRKRQQKDVLAGSVAPFFFLGRDRAGFFVVQFRSEPCQAERFSIRCSLSWTTSIAIGAMCRLWSAVQTSCAPTTTNKPSA